MTESVFAVPTDVLWKILTRKETGLIKEGDEVLDKIVNCGLFRNRSELERDASFKQLIPYSLISHYDARKRQSFFLFQRTSGQVEKRLQNKFHLGAGGHMNPGAVAGPESGYLLNELKRELFEEVRFFNGCIIRDIKFIGFINDDTIPVGTVHLGLLYHIHVSNKNVDINEKDKMTGKWVDKTDLMDYYSEMETWSKIAVDFYIMQPGTLL